ncbi:AAA family ATPase [Sinorhizobium medicae]|nr:AAA family ATPase [Sinorhizobium medicae]MDX0535833.1 AAA family ATPase [Sinorhizobium medicae]MDX0621625.1 AAA family ATPase [Sinorhizobium medicae]MDX0690614.1 AAA family ATPase [Sinorhizobium medicae]MDX0751857.1 AAA family ATPase [Sinorhizobium medicae]
MLLRSMFAENYRSLRSIRMDLAGVNLFIGENGVGKSNLYRGLQLVQAAVRGHFAREIAEEAGMASAIWSGSRRAGKPARIRLDAELMDEERAITFRYRIEAGFRPPKAAAGFAYEPEVKEEELTVETGRRPVTVMKRAGPGILVRGERGRMADYPEQAMTSETAISLLGDAGHYPEIGSFRRAVDQWRFFHGFRTDRDSPLRMPCLAITAPLLDESGFNMAAVFATLRHTRQDTVDLDRAIADAFAGAYLDVPEPGQFAEFSLVLPEFPRRPFSPRELSDGQMRFLALAAALLSYRRPRFIALNEPETSLHPDMLPALAAMIASAARESQIWIVTHSELLAAEVHRRCGVRPRRVIRREGATWIDGMRQTGLMADEGDQESS